MGGLFNVLEVAREMHCAVFTPSSIGVFGNNTPKDKTPQDTIRNPRTMYGVTKVSGELLSDYYNIRFGVDTRSVRFPGLISYVTPPGGGTTDYAVDIYYSAAKGEKFVCPIKQGTFMDMMYMPDGLRAAIEIMEADSTKFVHRNSFNIASMSFDPEIIYNNIKSMFLTSRWNMMWIRYVRLSQNHGLTLWMTRVPVRNGAGNRNMIWIP